MKNSCALVLAILMVFSVPGAAEEGPQVDFILLVDTSLSMVPAMEELKQYVAAGIVGPFVQQGDWVAVLAFYGKSTLIWEGDIQTEVDKAALIRSLHALEATGRFTDIGTALDDMKQLVIRRNRPDIPKYILLLTDEVQEAPPGSSYGSNDFTVRHELLEYIRRVDRGSFQAITVGYGLAGRIESDVETLMKTLNDPPDRPERFLPGGSNNLGGSNNQAQDASALGNTPSALPGGPSSTEEGGQENAATVISAAEDTTTENQDNKSIAPAGTKKVSKTDAAPRTPAGSRTWIYIIAGLILGVTILVLMLLVLWRSKKSHSPRRVPDDGDKNNPSKLKDGKQ